MQKNLKVCNDKDICSCHVWKSQKTMYTGPFFGKNVWITKGIHENAWEWLSVAFFLVHILVKENLEHNHFYSKKTLKIYKSMKYFLGWNFVLKKIKNHFVHTRKMRDTDVNGCATKHTEHFYP